MTKKGFFQNEIQNNPKKGKLVTRKNNLFFVTELIEWCCYSLLTHLRLSVQVWDFKCSCMQRLTTGCLKKIDSNTQIKKLNCAKSAVLLIIYNHCDMEKTYL